MFRGVVVWCGVVVAYGVVWWCGLLVVCCSVEVWCGGEDLVVWCGVVCRCGEM